ncbi:MAG: TraR/DksA family transcriptional regulator [Bdellovibrionales bacterium]
MANERIRSEFISELRIKLILKRADLINRLRNQHEEITTGFELRGDEIDQVVAVQSENTALTFQNRIRIELQEIESALSRMEMGTFGICEETEELIEIERLMALPWTRLSIEGAEIREALRKRFA